VDAPVSGGVQRASMGTLTVWSTSLNFSWTALLILWTEPLKSCIFLR
jgi:hypothetical protein